MGDYVRDEEEPATSLRDLLDILNAAGVSSAFRCIIADYTLPHCDAPPVDADTASYRVVKVLGCRLVDTYPKTFQWNP